MDKQENELVFKRLGIHTQHEYYAYMREDCHVCKSEGFSALTRLRIGSGKKSIVCSLNIVRTDLLKEGEISLSESAMHALNVKEGARLTVSHLHPILSLSYVRSKIFGNELDEESLKAVVKDIVDGNYSNIHLSAFVTACAGNKMSFNEMVSLTKAMIVTGKSIHWKKKMVVDKHCIGGLPGNRTTPIIVSIVAACGLTIPKTSSRAITSPAGTADTMEVMTNVALSMYKIRKVVQEEGGCFVWGGTALLSPADDMLIKVEKALDIDVEAQLIASVLSKKVAAGSNHVIIDMPVGETAKIRSIEAANEIKINMEKVAHEIGLKLKVVITDGTQPVGRGIGPVLEARDVLAVLRNEEDAPQDLEERALLLAGELLELSGKVEPGEGNGKAREVLKSGKAYKKFLAICKAQGGFKEPVFDGYKFEVQAKKSGVVTSVDNRRLAKIAKLAGAPEDKQAGVDYFSPIGKEVKKGDTLFVIHADSEGELNYALEYVHAQNDIVEIKNEE